MKRIPPRNLSCYESSRGAAGNFGTVFVDQAYWQSAIAAKPSSSHKGYLLGGMLWFCIPFTLATTLGIASR